MPVLMAEIGHLGSGLISPEISIRSGLHALIREAAFNLADRHPYREYQVVHAP